MSVASPRPKLMGELTTDGSGIDDADKPRFRLRRDKLSMTSADKAGADNRQLDGLVHTGFLSSPQRKAL